MRLEPELRRVLNRHDALLMANLTRERIEQRRLSRPRSTSDGDVHAMTHRPAQKPRIPLRHRAQTFKLGHGRNAIRELSNGDDWPLEGNRRDHGIDAVAVGKARINDGARLVQAATQGRKDAIDHHHDLLRRVKHTLCREERSSPLVIEGAAAIDHDLAHGRIIQQWLQWPEPHHLIDDLAHELVLAVGIDRAIVARIEDGVASDRQLVTHHCRIIARNHIGHSRKA